MKRYAVAPIGLALCAYACSGQVPPPSPPTFGRPEAVAFVCYDAQGLNWQKLDACRPTATKVDTTVTITESVYSMNALVTQSNRGEVAAVDLVAKQVIDSRQDIPGYTFVPAGELPGPIVTPPNHPALTYVANTGSRDISILNTLYFRHQPVLATPVDDRVAVTPSPDKGAQPPSDMLLSPDEDALFVSAPDGGWLLRFPIERCDGSDPSCREGQIDTAHVLRIPIELSLSKASSDMAPPTPDEEYQLVCDPSTLIKTSPTVGVSLTMPSDTTPRPVALAIDSFCKANETCTRRLLVADQNLPIIHAIDIDALTSGDPSAAILAPIVTGVPTAKVAVSPRVPVDVGKTTRETQYVYAIDASDGSVLVTQNGHVINVSADPNVRANRLDVGPSYASGAPVALSLELLTPAYDVHGAVDQWVMPNSAPIPDGTWLCGDSIHPTRTANRLRGVFLAVGLTDGTVRIVDVHDLELTKCRTCDQNALSYDPYPIRRHRPRIGLVYTLPTSGAVAPPSLPPTVTPQFQIGGTSIVVNADGTTNDPRATNLDCVACASGEAPSFPPIVDETGATGEGAAGGTSAADGGNPSGGASNMDGGTSNPGACSAGQGRVCSLADPWVDPLNWTAYREGIIPGASGGLGRFADASSDDNVSGSLEFIGEARFCETGVLGDDDIGDVDGDKQPDGDQVLITSVLPDVDTAARAGVTGQTRSDCEAIVNARDNDDQPIAFRITRAFGDRLVIAPNAIVEPASNVRVQVDWNLVQNCFLGELMTYQVHSRQSYVVLSSNGPGFQHRVVRDAKTNRCVIDQTKDPKLNGRAYDGLVFDNGYISFKTLSAPAQRDTVLNLSGVSNVGKLVLNATAISSGNVQGVLPVQLKYNDIDQQLYVIDVTTRGLIPVPLDIFPSAVLSSYQ